MPTLNWIGKKAVENHHREVPFHLLKDVPDLSVGDPGTGNLIVEGDNLLALKALLPYYAGQVKCIYIDPPYNTGNEGWIYNDNVNSPEIRQWLGKVVGSELEDLTRHDKWLCMMYPRLALLRQFLKEDGVIFISIDDNEIHTLRYLLDDIYGARNFVTNFIWKKKGTSTNVAGAGVSELTEYVVAYQKSSLFKINPRVRSKETREHPLHDAEGNYRLTIIEKKNAGEYQRDTMRFPILGKTPRAGKRWQIGLEKARELEAKNRFVLDKGVVRLKIYDFEERDTLSAQPNLLDDHGSSESGSRLANQEILGAAETFSNPKPIELISHLIAISTGPGDIILDSFAGSGTTAHAVLQLNKQDDGNRRFVLVEIESKIARDITATRVKRVASGYKTQKSEKIEGTGGGFRFCQLSDPLFDENGKIRASVRFAELARHVFFTETGEPLPKQSKAASPLLGIYNGVAVYLLYNGILKDKSPDGGNVLTTGVLSHLPKHKGPRVIYGTACRIGASRLRQQNITFKQLPYKLKVDAL